MPTARKIAWAVFWIYVVGCSGVVTAEILADLGMGRLTAGMIGGIIFGIAAVNLNSKSLE